MDVTGLVQSAAGAGGCVARCGTAAEGYVRGAGDRTGVDGNASTPSAAAVTVGIAASAAGAAANVDGPTRAEVDLVGRKNDATAAAAATADHRAGGRSSAGAPGK